MATVSMPAPRPSGGQKTRLVFSNGTPSSVLLAAAKATRCPTLRKLVRQESPEAARSHNRHRPCNHDGPALNTLMVLAVAADECMCQLPGARRRRAAARGERRRQQIAEKLFRAMLEAGELIAATQTPLRVITYRGAFLSLPIPHRSWTE